MEIKIIPCVNSDIWSANLHDFDYSIFISKPWVESLKDVHVQTLYLDFFSNGDLIAKISGLSYQSKFSYQRKLVFYAGPAIKKNLPANVIDQCIILLVNYAKINKYCRMVLLSYDYRHVSDYSKDLGFSERFEYVVDLMQSRDKLLDNFAKDIKRRNRFALKNGFVFKKTDSIEILPTLIHLMEETKRIRLSKGYSNYNYFYLPGFTQKAFENLINEKAIQFFYVEKDSIICGVQAVMLYEQKAYALLIGVNEEGYKNGVPSFIDYQLVCSLKDNNYEYLDFGGIPIDKSHKGLVHFKKSIGATAYVSTYGSTNFLILPYTLLNPIVRIIRKFPENRLIKYIKQLLNL